MQHIKQNIMNMVFNKGSRTVDPSAEALPHPEICWV